MAYNVICKYTNYEANSPYGIINVEIIAIVEEEEEEEGLRPSCQFSMNRESVHSRPHTLGHRTKRKYRFAIE